MENQQQAITERNPTHLTLTGQSRPQLAVLNEDFKKVREEGANELSELLNYIIAMLNLKVDDGDKDKMDMQMLMVGDLIRTEFGSLTIPEIKTAFKMYVSQQLPVKVFRILDCISTGEVLNAFIDYRNESLRVYDEKKRKMEAKNQLPEVSDTEKENLIKGGIVRVFNEFKETKVMPEPCSHVFDYLYEKGIIKQATSQTPKIQAYYQKKYEQAQKEVEAELKATEVKSSAELRDIKSEIEKVLNNQSNKVIIRSKRIILAEYCEKLIIDGKSIEQIIN